MDKKKLNEEVEKAMNSLEGLRRAEPGNLFVEKVMMRLRHPEARVMRMTPRSLLQAAACIALLILLNVFVWLKTSSSAPEKTEQKNPLAQEYFSYMNSNIQF